jgi:membrane protein
MRLRNRFENLPLVRQILEWSKSHSFMGFKGVNTYQAFYFLIQESKRNDIKTRASAMTYHFFMALFPSLIFLFTLTAYLPKSLDFYKALEQSIISILPKGAEDYVITDIINSLRPRARSSFLSIGFILAIWFGSGGIIAMMRGFDKTYKSSFRKRKWMETHITAVALTFALGMLLISSVLSLIFGEKFLRLILPYMHLSGFLKVALSTLKYLVTVVMFYTVISLVYRYGPAIHRPIRGLSPGAFLATIASILTSILFGFFVDKMGSYHRVYGAISALIITLLWIRLNTLILILGFELNAAIIVNRDLMSEEEIQKSLQEAE